MSSKFLFIYNTPLQRAKLIKCEKVIKALFRKFRKSAVFTYLQADTSPPCTDTFRYLIFDEFQKNDAVFAESDIPKKKKDIIFKDILGEYAEVHFLKNCAICHPSSSGYIEEKEDGVICSHILNRENLSRAVKIATNLSLDRKKKLTVCSDGDFGSFLEDAVSCSFDKSLHIERVYLSLDEALLICINTIPEFDSVLTTEQAAKILQMHIGYMGGFYSSPAPEGYSIIYTDKGRIYTRQTFPYEQMDNTFLFSSLLALSAIIEKELSMKSAADWLKRACSLSFETHRKAEEDDFINRVISEIEKPMRKHER